MITSEEMRLIQFLQRSPMATFVQVAEFLGITPPTAKRKFLQLTNGQKGVIKNVVAKPNLHCLEMKKWTLILFFNDWKSFNRWIQELYQFALDHPYTSYINQVYGSRNGTILQFNIPEKGEQEFFHTITYLKDILGADMILFKDEDFRFETKINLNHWEGRSWEFDFEKWFFGNQNPPWRDEHQFQPTDPSILGRMRMEDIIIIRELMINSRRKHTEIIEDINQSEEYDEEEKEPFSMQRRRQISRRFEFIETHGIIEDYELLFDKRYLGIDHFLIFTGQLEKGQAKELKEKIKDPEFPFYSQLRTKANDFYWLVHLPPALISEMTRFIFSISKTFDILHLDPKPENSFTFPIWHRNFVENQGWKISSEWMGIDFVKKRFKIN